MNKTIKIKIKIDEPKTEQETKEREKKDTREIRNNFGDRSSLEVLSSLIPSILRTPRNVVVTGVEVVGFQIGSGVSFYIGSCGAIFRCWGKCVWGGVSGCERRLGSGRVVKVGAVLC